jgi:hypothetical protein
MIFMATLAAFGGFCLASASAFAALRYNIWQSSGPSFQLGYVIGYLDAVALAQRKDVRLQVPNVGGKKFDHWVRDVNAFYEDPANQTRPVPDAIYEVGSKVRDEMLRNWGLQQMGKPTPNPSAQP